MIKSVLLIILTVSSFKKSHGQITDSVEKYRSTIQRGLCNSSISLYHSGFYCFEGGCEGSSHISYGNWTIKNDTIHFTQLNNKEFHPIDTVFFSSYSSDSITVVILDKYGTNITNKISVGLYVQGAGVYPFRFDISNNMKKALKRPNGFITLITLNRIFQKDFDFATDTANDFIIKLNISADWIYSPNSRWGGFGDFDLIKNNDELVSFSPQFPQKEIFRKEDH